MIGGDLGGPLRTDLQEYHNQIIIELGAQSNPYDIQIKVQAESHR